MKGAIRKHNVNWKILVLNTMIPTLIQSAVTCYLSLRTSWLENLVITCTCRKYDTTMKAKHHITYNFFQHKIWTLNKLIIISNKPWSYISYSQFPSNQSKLCTIISQLKILLKALLMEHISTVYPYKHPYSKIIHL